MQGSASDQPSLSSSGRLVIVCGLPGSGKTTLAKHLSADGAAVRMNSDDWMEALGINLWDLDLRAKIEAIQWRLSRELLAQGLTVVIEWGTWSRMERDTLRREARGLGAGVELRYLAVDIDELWRRVRSRRFEEPPMTRADLERWLAEFEAPDADELALFDPF